MQTKIKEKEKIFYDYGLTKKVQIHKKLKQTNKENIYR